MLAPLLISIAAAVAALLAALYAKSAVAVAARSAPNALSQGHQDLSDRVLAVEANVAAQNSKLTAWRAEIEGVLDSVEGMLESTERKRRQAAASASRAERANGGPNQDPNTMSDVDLVAIAQQRGLW